MTFASKITGYPVVIGCLLFIFSCLTVQGSGADKVSRRDAILATQNRDMLISQPPAASPTPLPANEKTIVPAGATPGQPPLRITSDKYLDYDEESNFIYGRTRTRVWYRDVYLEADRLIYDVRLNEVQAYGDVILRQKGDEYRADSLWFSLDKGRGYAYGASGHHKDIYIHSDPKEKDVPTFELLDQTEAHQPREALFRKSSFTTCDFPLPHYRIQGKEILLYTNDRIFIRDATFYLWEIPVFYLPAYTGSLVEASPWSFQLGYNSRLGAYLRLGYEFHHGEYEPAIGKEDMSSEDMRKDKVWVPRSKGSLYAHVDFFTKRGIGYGAKYDYSFSSGAPFQSWLRNYDQHKGSVELYRINDRKFKVTDYSSPYRIEEDDTYTRWIGRVRHRSQLTDEIYLQLDIDEMSDPDIYYDILDRFNTIERKRVPERNIRGALTYRSDDYIGRLLFQLRNRIGRDRVTNFADPFDNDRDFDIDPYGRERIKYYEGFPRNRYGKVSEKLPQFTFSTNYLKLGSLPLYTYTDINIFNNLDKGLNTVSEKDDAWVRGVDVYQALLYRWKLGSRYTLTARLGVGAAFTDRENSDFNYGFPSGTSFPYDMPEHMGGLTFLDDDTFLVGRRHYDNFGNLITTPEELAEWRHRSLDEVRNYYLYADAMIYFHARLTDYLHAWIRYDYRVGTKDSLGDFYESLGDVLTRHDLYNFRLPEHWIRAGLNYFLRYPNMSAYLSGGYNLQSGKDIYPNEELYYVALGMNYTNNARTFTFDTSMRYTGRQEYDRTDPWSGNQDFVWGVLNAQYIPLSKLWWTRLTASGHKALNAKSHSALGGYEYNFEEYDTDFSVRGTLGGKIGPKYVVETQVEYRNYMQGSGISEVRLIIKRDLHDFIASLQVGLERDVEKVYYNEKNKAKLDVKFNIELKMPYRRAIPRFGATSINTLADVLKEAELAGEVAQPVRVGD